MSHESVHQYAGLVSHLVSDGGNEADVHGRLLDATIEILHEVGDFGLTVSAVAKRAGVTTGPIYFHFGDRAGLVAAAYGERARRRTAGEATVVTLARHIFTAGPEDVSATVRVAIAMTEPKSRGRRIDILEAILAAEHNHAVQSQVEPVMDDVVQQVTQLIAASQEAGQVVTGYDPAPIAVTFIGAALGLTALAAFTSHDSTPEAKNALLNVYLRLMHSFKAEPWTTWVPLPEE